MPNDVKALILDLMPSDGSAIGNQSVLLSIRKRLPHLSEAGYQTARDQLVADGFLGRGRGRGGSVYRTNHASLHNGEDSREGEYEKDSDEEELELSTETPIVATPSATAGKKCLKSGQPVLVLSYRHPEKRPNNPEVGMVHPENDPDQAKTVWAYDPHIDPALQFDVGRAGIETLIDDAMASDDSDRMRDALSELRQLQAPYLTWTGKAERTSFQVDTVSLHVHERINPARILAAVERRGNDENKLGQRAFQPSLFDTPFVNFPLRQALEFYKHDKDWSNRLIAGDSLLVMTSLLQKENMAAQVQMIYMDPPYGIKYGSNFQPFTSQKEVKDGRDQDLTQEPEMIKAFRDTWELGIHSYLTARQIVPRSRTPARLRKRICTNF